MYYAENLGFAEILDSEDTFNGFVRLVAQEGTPIKGYYGFPYLNKHFGDAQFIERTVYNDEKDSYEVTGLDTHGAGSCVWQLKYCGIGLKFEKDDPTQFRGVFNGTGDEAGIVPIEVVNADVLPGLLEGDLVELQMIAFPEFIEYFASKDDYEESIPETELGQKWLVAEGSVFPSALVANHLAYKGPVDNSPDDLNVVIQSTVKHLYIGELTFGEETLDGYIRCIVDTNYGELEIVHDYKGLDENSKKNIKVGSIVFGVFRLSGDAAIDEYSEGIVVNEENNFQLIRYTINGGNPARLRRVLSEEVTYVSDSWEEKSEGIDEVIERFQYIKDHSDHTFYAHKAVIDEVNGDSELADDIGKECLILACDEPDNYESILFLDFTEDGMIKTIRVSRDTGYKFKVKSTVTKKITMDDIAKPENCFNSMVGRAKLWDFLNHDITQEEILSGADEENSRDLYRMLQAWPDNVEQWDDDYMQNLFGYMFAKAIETEFTESTHIGDYQTYHLVSYSPNACWNEKYNSSYKGVIHDKLELAMKYGKQFYNDFSFVNEKGKENYREELEKAIYWVRCIGKRCAERYLSDEKED